MQYPAMRTNIHFQLISPNRIAPLVISAALFLLCQSQTAQGARSLTARRVRATSPQADRYDRSITTFHPSGRLLQLEYSLIAAEERGWGVTVALEWEGVVILAFPSAVSEEECGDGDDDRNDNDKTHDFDSVHPTFTSDPNHNTKIHRLSPTHLLLTSGLAGDARMLASSFRRQIASWTHIDYGEVVSAREVAREVEKVRGGIGRRAGVRVLGVWGLVVGLDDVDSDETCDNLGVQVRMYRSLPGGIMDRCNACCSGGGADANGNLARKEVMEALEKVLSHSSHRNVDESNESGTEDLVLSENESLQQIIEEVGRIALMHHPFNFSTNGEYSSENQRNDYTKDTNTKQTRGKGLVDIYVIKAVPVMTSSNINRDEIDKHACTQNSFDAPPIISEHRSLGTARMNVRYARRVALDQLKDATDCLLQTTGDCHKRL
ncbi:hypothetical protein ACHAXS_002145 [Conticribra weissflogii]